MWEKSITILKAKGEKNLIFYIEARKPKKNNQNKRKSFFSTSKSKSFMNSHWNIRKFTHTYIMTITHYHTKFLLQLLLFHCFPSHYYYINNFEHLNMKSIDKNHIVRNVCLLDGMCKESANVESIVTLINLDVQQSC